MKAAFARLLTRLYGWVNAPGPQWDGPGLYTPGAPYPADDPVPNPPPANIPHRITLRMQSINRKEYGHCSRISYEGDKAYLCDLPRGSKCPQCNPRENAVILP